MAEFYERLKLDLVRAETQMTDIKRMEKPTDLICDKCGKPMVTGKWEAWQLHRLHRISRVHQHAGIDGGSAGSR